MQTITLAKPWTYLTPQVTIEYPAGEHEVTDTVARAYAAENEEKADGDGAATTRSARAARTT